MAKVSAVNRNKKREKMTRSLSKKRAALKATVSDKSVDGEARFVAQMKLDALPKNACPVRVHNRCEITGRPKAFYRKFRVSRIALRDMASNGQLPGVTKSSW
ncbi:MAG: 30S ribosomal protein S14 [Alphaproteobacteria bacterium]